MRMPDRRKMVSSPEFVKLCGAADREGETKSSLVVNGDRCLRRLS